MRELKYVAVVVGAGNLILLALFVTSLAGAMVAGGDGPAPVDSAAAAAASEPGQAEVPDGYRMVCHASAAPVGVIRSKPDLSSPAAGYVPKGELVQVLGPVPGRGFVKVQWTASDRQIVGWMHTELLATRSCK
jgi:hypothetical protein